MVWAELPRGVKLRCLSQTLECVCRETKTIYKCYYVSRAYLGGYTFVVLLIVERERRWWKGRYTSPPTSCRSPFWSSLCRERGVMWQSELEKWPLYTTPSCVFPNACLFLWFSRVCCSWGKRSSFLAQWFGTTYWTCREKLFMRKKFPFLQAVLTQ